MPIEVQANLSSAQIAETIHETILQAIPGAEIEVRPGGVGHFEIRVESDAFEGLGRVKQQQLVYGAISELLSGSNPPVHAIDKLDCVVP
ncbi:MAG: BolA/IbaG family iron-sulfur metabolism protein [Myxococcota bacterium]|jgi:acid stress-induced BolA-like protein IbaG/YrbA|nr:BolA/IbaG family iron-sulfur metabolism protein [Myxococcota bacterium]